MRILMIGGPLDGQLHEITEQLSPLTEMTVKATLPDGIIVVYRIVFFSGAKAQFPICVFETLGPDDVFKALLQWYAIKTRVRPVAPPTPPQDSIIDAKSEPVAESEQGKIVLP